MQPLINFNISTEEVRIKNNHLPEGSFIVTPKYIRSINKNETNSQASVTLSVEIGGSESAPFPIDVRIAIKGTFDLTNIPSDQVDSFLKTNATQILFPYLRTALSTSLGAAMMPPIILPIIDVRDAFNDNAENG